MERLNEEVANATVPSDGNVTQLMYESLFYNYEPVVGGCTTWSQFLNNRALTKAVNVQKINSISLYTIKNLYDGYNPAHPVLEKRTCTYPRLSKEFLSTLQRTARTSSFTPYNISCGGSTWKLKSCLGNYSLPSVCVDCDDPCTVHCSNARELHYMNPCMEREKVCVDSAHTSKRNGVINSISILSITISESIAAPDILSIAYGDIGATAAKLYLTLSTPGIVHCGLFENNLRPKSLSDVKIQKNSAFTTTNGISAQNSSVATIFLADLAAMTNYSLYCFTTARNGANMLFSRMLTTGHSSFRTGCCKSVFISIYSSVLFSGQVYTRSVQMSLSALPSNRLNISISLPNSAVAIYPSQWDIDPNTLSPSDLTIPVYLNTMSAVDGVFELVVSLEGPSATEYMSVYNANNSLTILSADATAPVPRLQSAVYSTYGDSFLVYFDSDTNLGGMKLKSIFACSHILIFDSSEESECVWLNRSTIAVYPFINQSALESYNGLDEYNRIDSSPSVTAGSYVRVREGKIAAAQTADSRYMLESGTDLLPPSNAVPPSLSVSGPLFLGGCDSLTVDLVTGSVVNGGSRLLNVSVLVTSLQATDTSLWLMQSFFHSDYILMPATPIPGTLMDKNVEYTFQVTACNMFLLCASVTHTVTVLNDSTPLIGISGQSIREVYASDPVVLYSEVAVQRHCWEDLTKIHTSVSWMVKRGNKILSDITSTAPNPTVFSIPAYTLTAGNTYLVYATGYDDTTFVSAFNFVQIHVLTGSLRAVIAGASAQSISVGQTLALDATGSYDEDDRASHRLDFEWSCFEFSPAFSNECSSVTLSASNSSVFRVYAQVGNSSLMCSVRVTDEVDGRSDSASVYIQIVPSSSSGWIVESSLSVGLDKRTVEGQQAFILNPQQALKVRSSVTVSIFASSSANPMTVEITSKWSVRDASDVSRSFLTPTMYRNNCSIESTASQEFCSFSANLVLSGNVLLASTFYSFSLQSAASVSSLLIYTNSLPRPGSFLVNPMRGTELSTQFQFAAAYWQDDSLPLTFTFGYSFDRGLQIDLNSRSEKCHVFTVLPCVSRGGQSLPVFLTVFDDLGANNTVWKDISVLRNLSLTSTQLTTFMTRASESNDLDRIQGALIVTGSMLASVNCSMALDCFERFHRLPCQWTSGTCGPCFNSSYWGVPGDSNSFCHLIGNASTSPRRQLTQTQSCASSSDCLAPFETCASGLCSIPDLSCAPINCSERGLCRLMNKYSGEAMTSCKINSVFCVALCRCFPGFFGSDCQFDYSAYQARSALREELIGINLLQMQYKQPNLDTMKYLLASTGLLSSASTELTYQTMNSTIDTLVTILEIAVSIRPSARDLAAFPTVLDPLYELCANDSGSAVDYVHFFGLNITSLSDSQIDLLEDMLAVDWNTFCASLSIVLDQLLAAYLELVGSDMLPGQQDFKLIASDSLRLFVSVSPSRAVLPKSTAFPLSDLEELVDASPNAVMFQSLPSQPLNGRQTIISGVLKSYTLYYSRSTSGEMSHSVANPLQLTISGLNYTAAEEWIIHFDLPTYQTVSNFEQSKAYFQTQCFDKDDFHTDYLCDQGLVGLNITATCPGQPGLLIDSCPLYNQSTSCEYWGSRLNDYPNLTMSCSTTSQSPSNVSCLCAVHVPPPVSGTNTQNQSLSFVVHAAQSVSYQSGSSLFIASDSHARSQRSYIVFISMGMFATLLLFMCFSSLGAEVVDRKKWSKAANDFIEKEISGGVTMKETNVNRENRVAMGKPPLDTAVFHLHDEDEEGNREDEEEEEEENKRSSLQKPSSLYVKDSLLRESLPRIYLTPNLIVNDIWREVKVYHRWVTFFFHGSVNYPRIQRLAVLAANITSFLFFNTLIYIYTDPDTGFCNALRGERRCRAESSKSCFWEYADHSCQFTGPAVTLQFEIGAFAVAGMLSAIFSKCIERVLIKVRYHSLKSRNPRPSPDRSGLGNGDEVDGGDDDGDQVAPFGRLGRLGRLLLPTGAGTTRSVQPVSFPITPIAMQTRFDFKEYEKPSNAMSLRSRKCRSFTCPHTLEQELDGLQSSIRFTLSEFQSAGQSILIRNFQGDKSVFNPD